MDASKANGELWLEDGSEPASDKGGVCRCMVGMVGREMGLALDEVDPLLDLRRGLDRECRGNTGEMGEAWGVRRRA